MTSAIDSVNTDNGAEWRTWVVVLTLAMLFGLMEAAQLRLGSSVLGQGMPIGVALARVLPYWGVAAVVMMAIAAIGRRFRVWQFLLRPNLPAVAATATGLAVLALAGRVLLATADPRTGLVLRPTPLQLFQTYFALDLLTYTAFVGTLYAFHYYREARRREITASQLQASLAEARLGGLEARIDPDFLFNTLTDISTLAAQGQQRPVIDRLGRLSEVLRAALSDQRPEEIPLRQELTLLESYLTISDSGPLHRDSIQVDMAPDVLTALVPRMMLPTIAEQILRRAKDEHSEAWTVTVRGTRLDETVRLEMTVACEPSSSGDWGDDEFELDGLREQLHRLYGRAQSIDLMSRDAAVVASISIPFAEGLAGEGGPNT